MEGLLAVGDEPSSDDKMNWLLIQGFQAFVSLGKNSKSVTDQILKSQMSSYFYNKDVEQMKSSIRDIMELFIASHFYCQRPVYVFCSVGIEIASGVAKRFMAQKDLHIANYLGRRANDLNHGDEFDWMRGHEAFYGNNIYQAISALTIALSNKNPKIQLASADTLAELMDHVGHRCFPKAAVKALIKVRVDVQDIVLRCNPKYRAAYEEIFKSFDKLI